MVNESSAIPRQIVDDVTKENISKMKTLLNLKDDVYPHDTYLAAYHFLTPEYIGCNNYKDLLKRREQTRIEQSQTILTIVPPQKKSTPKKTFEQICDDILMEFENGDFLKIASLTPKQATFIRNKLKSYFETDAEFKELDPIGLNIYNKLNKVAATVGKKQTEKIDKLCKLFNLITTFHNLEAKPTKLLFSESQVFVLYDTVNQSLIYAKVGDPSARWQGVQTLIGDIHRINIQPKLLATVVSARSLNTMIERFPKRVITSVPSVRIRSNLILLKIFKK